MENTKEIINLLNEKDNSRKELIDKIVYIFDVFSRDYSELISFINEKLMLLLGGEYKRFLIALNKIDIVNFGFYFNKTKNEPEKVLENRLKEKIESVKKKVKKDYDILLLCWDWIRCI